MSTDLISIDLHYNLLQKVKGIIEKSNELSRLKGEAFNVFSVLKIDRDEVTTHNRLIAELLNPNGTHGQGNAFLKLFLEQLQNSENSVLSERKQLAIKRLKKERCTATAELWLGKNDYESEEGGSVDVCIQGSSAEIFIENKIDAGDQFLQIARYCTDDPNTNRIVLYTTLDGKLPSKESRGKRVHNQDYFCWSHAEDTIAWLNACYRYSADFPILRETIKQYRILFQKLTNQLTSNDMNEELLNLLLSDSQTLQAAKDISKYVSSAEKKIYQDITEELAKSMPEGVEIQRDRDGRIDGGFIYLRDAEAEGGTYQVGLNLELDNSYLFFCLMVDGKKRSNINNDAKFDELADYLHRKKYSMQCDMERLGYCLLGKFKLSRSFNRNEFVDMNAADKRIYVDQLIQDVNSIISESEIQLF